MMYFTCIQDGVTSLHLASFNGHKEVIELLLDSGASVDKADEVPTACIRRRECVPRNI